MPVPTGSCATSSFKVPTIFCKVPYAPILILLPEVPGEYVSLTSKAEKPAPEPTEK